MSVLQTAYDVVETFKLTNQFDSGYFYHTFANQFCFIKIIFSLHFFSTSCFLKQNNDTLAESDEERMMDV